MACKQIAEGKHAKLELMNDWTAKYNMVCDRADLRDTYQSLYIFVNTAISLVVLQVADVWGRRACFTVSGIICTFGAVSCNYLDHFGAKVIMAGVAFSGMMIYGSLYTFSQVEVMNTDFALTKYIVSGYIIAFPLGYMAFCLVSFYSIEPDFLSMFTMIGIALGTLTPLLFIRESPQFILSKGTLQHLMKECDKIRHLNGLPVNREAREKLMRAADTYMREVRGAEIEQKTSFFMPLVSIIKSRVYLFRTITLTLITGFYIGIFYGVNLNMQDMGPSSVAMNGIYAGFSQIVSVFLMAIFLRSLTRKKWTITLQLTILVAASLLAVLSSYKHQASVPWLMFVLSTWIINPIQNMSFIPLAHYINELYPVELRGTSTSLTNSFGTLVGMGGVLFGSWTERIGLHPLVGCCAIGLLSTPLTYFLRETV